jgi:hypothetical protein
MGPQVFGKFENASRAFPFFFFQFLVFYKEKNMKDLGGVGERE